MLLMCARDDAEDRILRSVRTANGAYRGLDALSLAGTREVTSVEREALDALSLAYPNSTIHLETLTLPSTGPAFTYCVVGDASP